MVFVSCWHLSKDDVAAIALAWDLAPQEHHQLGQGEQEQGEGGHLGEGRGGGKGVKDET